MITTLSSRLLESKSFVKLSLVIETIIRICSTVRLHRDPRVIRTISPVLFRYVFVRFSSHLELLL